MGKGYIEQGINVECWRFQEVEIIEWGGRQRRERNGVLKDGYDLGRRWGDSFLDRTF